MTSRSTIKLCRQVIEQTAPTPPPRILLGAFAVLRKATISFVMSIRPSVHMEQLGSYWTDFKEIWYLSIFRKKKTLEKIQVSLKSKKNKGYITWRPLDIFDHISLISS